MLLKYKVEACPFPPGEIAPAWRKWLPSWCHLSPCWQLLARPSSWRRPSLDQWLQALLQSSNARIKPHQNVKRHAVGHLGVVGVRRQVAGLDHVHPGVSQSPDCMTRSGYRACCSGLIDALDREIYIQNSCSPHRMDLISYRICSIWWGLRSCTGVAGRS